MKTISAAEANRNFSRLLAEVAAGESVTVLSHGKPVAVFSPVSVAKINREEAQCKLLERLRAQVPTGETRDWTRNSLYCA